MYTCGLQKFDYFTSLYIANVNIFENCLQKFEVVPASTRSFEDMDES